MATLLTLPNLYASPNDIWDYLSTEGVDLRLDDHHLATGQIVIVTANAAALATTLSIMPLQFPLLKGTTIEFDGGGTPAVVQAVLSATATVGSVTLNVNPLSGAINANAQAFDSGVNVVTAQRLIKACQYGTSRVKDYCCNRYDDSDLATAYSPNRWATYLGSKWLCSRRGQTPPATVLADADEAIEELKDVRYGRMNISDIATRSAGWPFISNITVNVGYDYARVRVESPFSEGTPTQYAQYIDWNTALLLQW